MIVCYPYGMRAKLFGKSLAAPYQGRSLHLLSRLHARTAGGKAQRDSGNTLRIQFHERLLAEE